MAFKGFNSILFDFSSIVDIEISVIKWMRNKYRDSVLENFNKHDLLYKSIDLMEFYRSYGVEDVFESLITNQTMKQKSNEILMAIYTEYENEILTKSCAHLTHIINLISAYRKAGNGVIKTAVRCDNEVQAKFLKSIIPEIFIETCQPKDVDMGKYSRLITGSYKNALMYELKEPKSILIVNFRENFTENDITMLNPELVISLGDIHDIQIISAYSKDNDNEANG